MIFYFSATGNSKYVAKRLGEATGEEIVSIAECMRNGNFDFSIKEEENIGFVTPTYFWGLPTIVTEFIKNLNMEKNGNHYCFHVLTYGALAGRAHQMMDHYLRAKGLMLDGKFIVRMVDTWTPMFDLTVENKNQEILDQADIQIGKVIKKVVFKESGDFNNRKVPLAGLFYLAYQYGRKTSKFTVEDSCIDCGLCEKQCPVGAIKIENNKPKWLKSQCTLCLGCLHRCPVFAIQYGKKTKKHGQYVNPKVEL
jgi:NAD-dependent dihydropyrimidine dehydrogenase PreA subunit